MNADSRVMEYFPNTLRADESDAFAERIVKHFDEHDFGLWAVEIKNVDDFVGFIGLSIPQFEAHFTPCVEIGWRLAATHWGCGYATEGARAVLEFGFEIANLDEIVSMSSTRNHPSRRVMERIGMTRSPDDDFDHPRLPADHTLSRQVLYRVAHKAEFRETAGQTFSTLPAEHFGIDLSSDTLAIGIYANRQDMGKAAAAHAADYLRRLQQERGEIRIGVGSAPSQDEFFEHLTSALLLKSIDWDKVVVFHMDEYISLQANHPQSFRTYQQEHFISKIPAKTFHEIRGEAADPDGECLRLEALLAEKPLDLICLGMKVDPRVHMAKRRNGSTQTLAGPAASPTESRR